MGYTEITAQVIDRALLLTNTPKLSSGGVDDIRVTFGFCNLWASATGKTAVFYRDKNTVFHVPLTDNAVVAPKSPFALEGTIYMGVFADFSDGSVRTTEVVALNVCQGAITTENAPAQAPDIYKDLEQRVAAAEERVAAAEQRSAAAVLYTEQDLTNKQKAQARENIGVTNHAAKQSAEVVQIRPVQGTTVDVVSKITGMDAGYTYANQLRLRHTTGTSLLDVTRVMGGAGTTGEKNGVTYTVNANNTLTLNGTCTATGNIWCDFPSGTEHPSFPAGTYTIPADCILQGNSLDAAWSGIGGNKFDTFTIDKPWRVSCLGKIVNAGVTYDNVTVPLVMVAGTSLPQGHYGYEGNEYIATFKNTVADGEFNWQTGELRDTDGNLIETVAAFDPFPVLDGKNNLWTGLGVSTVSYDHDPGADTFEPDVWGLPVLYLTGDMGGISKDNTVTLDYDFKTHRGACTLKWQGSSSLMYAKKNYTIKFDKAFEAAAGWGAQKKYCLKANFIDHSHSRNIVNAKLWGQIVKSRTNVDERMASLVNGGATDGFPIIIMLNGQFHGLYTFNIPKDGWMYGMGNGNREAILCADVNTAKATAFKGTANLQSDFDLEYVSDENNAGWVLESLNRLITACINSDGTDLDTTIAEMLDWESAIDFYIFVTLTAAFDLETKNYLLVTYDGVKWSFGAYDMDCTHGIEWDGSAILRYNTTPVNAGDYHWRHRLMDLIWTYKKSELVARYNQLRNCAMSDSNVVVCFSNFAGKIPPIVATKDLETWPTIPMAGVNNISQIRDYYHVRSAFMDKSFNE